MIIQNQFGEAQAKELRVKQAQLAKANIEVDMNPNLIEIAPGGRPPKQKQKEEIPDIEPWFAASSLCRLVLDPLYQYIDTNAYSISFQGLKNFNLCHVRGHLVGKA